MKTTDLAQRLRVLANTKTFVMINERAMSFRYVNWLLMLGETRADD